MWVTIMRKLFRTSAALSVLLTTSMAANAADVPPYAPPPPVYAPPVYVPLWTGFYLGGNIGGAWRHDNVTDTLSGLNFSNGNNNGVFIGGGQLGFNWQVSNFVLGLEWDIDGAANNNNTGTVFIPALGTMQVTSNNRIPRGRSLLDGGIWTGGAHRPTAAAAGKRTSGPSGEPYGSAPTQRVGLLR